MTRLLRVALVGAAAWFAAGCADGRSVLVVTVDSAGAPLGPVSTLRVSVDSDGQDAGPYQLTLPTAATIPPAQTFSISFDARRSGAVHVSVEALDGGGNLVGSGAGDGTVRPSTQTALKILLVGGQGHPVDGGIDMTSGGPGDGATDANVDANVDAGLDASGDARAPGDATTDGGTDLPGLCGFPGAACCNMGAPCLMGCCNAKNVCTPGTAGSSCGVGGGLCLDCTRGPALGLGCVAGKCGCNGAADCPPGSACSFNVHICTPTCGATTTQCNGGCCGNGRCVSGTAGKECGSSGGICTDCTTMQGGGKLCVAGGCGCNGAGDCPPGNACDPVTHTCSQQCAGNLACNSGCCDGVKCVPGATNGACGTLGAACADCTRLAAAPTCSAGACVGNCGGAGDGSCGVGYCCNAVNVCAPVTNGSCGAAGASCVDCARSAAGPVCLGGACGCQSAADCPVGQACTNGACGAGCSMNAACNGSCCNGGTCAPALSPTTCGIGACMSCVASAMGHACVAGKCGCNAAIDCPGGQACNTATHLCSPTCDANTPCNGGCCANGMCQPGTAVSSCGANGGLCADCAAGFAAGKLGQVCQPAAGGGVCGCNTVNDCPAGLSCSNLLCGATCNVNAPCKTGCCGGGNCRTGTADSSCGGSGACVDCTTSPNGTVCVANVLRCGCNVAADCPSGSSCNTVTHSCESACGNASHTACNGGCCNGGFCVAGTANTACGKSGSCADCTLGNGGICLAGTCGCNGASDCATGTACNTTTHFCETTCGDASHTTCNGGCCAGATCRPGTANGTCGNSGGACVVCANDLPTCSGGRCTASCNVPGAGPCGGGFCCDTTRNTCVSGLASTTCGYSGSCVSCAQNGVGTRCVSAGPQLNQCGCATAADCLTNYACGGMACTRSCNANQPCNGGCCNQGTCSGGTSVAACGGDGLACTSCSNDPGGAQCIRGACGCTASTDCAVGESCNLNTNKCETACGANHSVCNEGCCNGAQCVLGTDTIACGADGSSCTDCRQPNPGGHLCTSAPSGSGGVCGCTMLGGCDLMVQSCSGSTCCTLITKACAPNLPPCCSGINKCSGGTCQP